MAKFDTNSRRSLAIVRDYAWLKLYCGYNNGDSAETIDTGYQINNSEWYHVGVSVDGVNRTAYIRVFRASNSAVTEYFKTFANQLHVEDADFTIGARHDGNGSYCHDGLLDEVVVFNELLTAKRSMPSAAVLILILRPKSGLKRLGPRLLIRIRMVLSGWTPPDLWLPMASLPKSGRCR